MSDIRRIETVGESTFPWEAVTPPPFPQRSWMENLLRGLALGAMVMAGFALLGVLGGSILREVRAANEQERIREVLFRKPRSSATERVEALRAAADRLPDNPILHSYLALSYLSLAKTADSPAVYRDEAQREIERARETAETTIGKPLEDHLDTPLARRVLLLEGTVLDELDRDAEALAAYHPLLDIRETLPTAERAEILNNVAYLLARSDDPAVRDPSAARELAAACIKAHPEASLNASYLDTLACSYYAMGNRQQAMAVQKRALALCGRDTLPVCLEHWDEFRAAQPRGNADADED